MSWYTIALFLHIVGAVALFAGISLEQLALRGLRRARTSSAFREWLTVLQSRRRVEAPAGVTLLVTGGYMAATWGREAWMGLAIVALLLIALLGAAGTGRLARALPSELPAGDGPIPLALRQRIGSPVLSLTASLRVALALGVIFDMTAKPPAAGAGLTLGTALLFGAVAPWLRSRSTPARREFGAEY